MRSQKRTSFFSLGRKWVFTHASKSRDIKGWLLKRGTALALFLLVFALSSVVKIHAGTSDSGSGWLWGGSDDGAGNNTGVGWISVNNTNQGGAVSYGLSIPSGTGDISGYAWSENIGWISFNAADIAGCPQGSCKAEKIAGNNFKGWARVLGIRDALAVGNSGGWQGWISLSGAQYGVKINADNTLAGYGWSDELGWIDFSRAKVTEVCSLAFVPSTTKTVNESSTNSEAVVQEVGSSCNCGSVSLSSSNASIASVSPASIDFSSPVVQSSNITLQMGSVSSTTNYPNIITASSTNCGTAKLGLLIQNVPVCALTCPSEVVVAPGQTKSVKSEIGITGETGCTASAFSCSESGTDANGNIDVTSSCDVSATGDLRYGSSNLQATGGTGSCTSPINVKGPGWTETNP